MVVTHGFQRRHCAAGGPRLGSAPAQDGCCAAPPVEDTADRTELKLMLAKFGMHSGEISRSVSRAQKETGAGLVIKSRKIEDWSVTLRWSSAASISPGKADDEGRPGTAGQAQQLLHGLAGVRTGMTGCARAGTSAGVSKSTRLDGVWCHTSANPGHSDISPGNRHGFTKVCRVSAGTRCTSSPHANRSRANLLWPRPGSRL